MKISEGIISEIECISCGDGNVSAFAVKEDMIYLQCNHCGDIFIIANSLGGY